MKKEILMKDIKGDINYIKGGLKNVQIDIKENLIGENTLEIIQQRLDTLEKIEEKLNKFK